MTKMLVFDMDGTIADLYKVNGWLADLQAERTRPYEIAEPMYNMVQLNKVLNMLKSDGWRIAVTTWTAKNGKAEYNKAVGYAKIEWLAKYDFPYDEIHIVKYGTTKANCTRAKAEYQILVDDNEKVRNGWTLGATINANNDIIEQLEKLIKEG